MTDSHGGQDGDESPVDGFFRIHPDPTLYFAGEDRDAHVVAANPAFEDVFGVSAETLTGEPLADVTMTDELSGLAGQLANESPVDETVACETCSGTSTFRVRSVTLAEDRVRGFLVYTPVGTRESIGDRQGDRVEELARVVSHELRNPLDSARTRITTARDTGDIDHLDTALRNIDRITSIISDLTTLAREGRLVGAREPVALAATVEEAWDTLDAEGATLTIEDDLGRVEADDGALEHLVENLLRNAVEHGSTGPDSGSDDDADGGGTVRGRDRVSVRVGSLVDGFYVADDGPGIPEEERDRIFDAGYTTTREGTGLGLRIVERVAEAHGWSVAVTDGATGGARFEITGVDSA
jgi:signal transduction histidine kinase